MFASEMKEPAKVVIKSNILDKKVPATPSRRSEEVASTPQAKTAHSVVRPASEAAPAASGAGAELPPVSRPVKHAKKNDLYIQDLYLSLHDIWRKECFIQTCKITLSDT